MSNLPEFNSIEECPKCLQDTEDASFVYKLVPADKVRETETPEWIERVCGGMPGSKGGCGYRWKEKTADAV